MFSGVPDRIPRRLIDEYLSKVLLYNHQSDLMRPYHQLRNVIKGLDWSGKTDYLETRPVMWRMNESLVGYVREVRNFREVLILGPIFVAREEAVLDMMKRFVFDQPFNTTE